jgi:MarR family transcriptional regulator, organic hydroperoxide resistance regulator
MSVAKKPDESLRLGPALDFLQGLWGLNHALERVSMRMEATLGITAQQRLIIRCVGKYTGMTSGQLAAVLHLDPGTVSTSLGRLERKGLLERRRDPRDKRRIMLGLTEEGRALDKPMKGTVEHAVERVLAEADAREITAARRMLDRLTDALFAEVNLGDE